MSTTFSRTFTRVPVRVRAVASITDSNSFEGVVHDLSMNGLSLETPAAPPIGATGGLEIVLEGGGGEVRISTEAEVKRVFNGRVAFGFRSVHGDDYEHLERLILYNAPDVTRVVAELQMHADEQPPMAGSVES